jgi:hypothetical protein
MYKKKGIVWLVIHCHCIALASMFATAVIIIDTVATITIVTTVISSFEAC